MLREESLQTLRNQLNSCSYDHLEELTSVLQCFRSFRDPLCSGTSCFSKQLAVKTIFKIDEIFESCQAQFCSGLYFVSS